MISAWHTIAKVYDDDGGYGNDKCADAKSARASVRASCGRGDTDGTDKQSGT